MPGLGLGILFLITIANIKGYKTPTPRVELLENGFRISIPDENGVKLVAFNANRNKNFTSFNQGQYTVRLTEPQNGRWTSEFMSVPLRAHDVLYLWTSVQHEKAVYQDMGQPLQVCNLEGNYLPRGCTSHEDDDPTDGNTANNVEGFVESTSPAPCRPSSTKVSPAPSGPICRGKLLFQETFDQLNDSIWLHEVRQPLDTKDAEFVLYDGRAKVEEGNLVIEPMLWSSYRPDLSIANARLDLSERCTGTHNRRRECVLQTTGSGPSSIMPPIVVPRINTKESFAFQYGRIEIRAKFPKGDWQVPLLLLEPLTEWYGQTGYESGQLRVAFARGNTKLKMPRGKLVDGRSLYGGPILSPDAQLREDSLVSQRRSLHFSNDFHTYSMDWSSTGLQFSVDGQIYGEMLNGFAELDLNPRWKQGGPMAPFDKLFYITLGLSVGGFGDFIDGIRTARFEKPWRNYHPLAKIDFHAHQSDWLPTWEQPAMLIDFVRVYAN